GGSSGEGAANAPPAGPAADGGTE
ncbi:MAG: hypothetical protein AVDCRST_MAG38-1569, partial [uncultured Solirubrobacteraceae bacterium]